MTGASTGSRRTAATKRDKVRESRGRLFATTIEGEGDNARVVGVGNVYQRLLADLFGDERFAKYKFVEASEKAPKKKDALNIEGLAATPDGQLLVAFRNPIPNGKGARCSDRESQGDR